MSDEKVDEVANTLRMIINIGQSLQQHNAPPTTIMFFFKHFVRELAAYPDAQLARVVHVSGVKLAKRLREQRDELAVAARLVLTATPSTISSAIEGIDDALRLIPTYEQQLRNIAKGLGVDYNDFLRGINAMQSVVDSVQGATTITGGQNHNHSQESFDGDEKLTQHAMVGGGVFHKGVAKRLVIDAAYRQYIYHQKDGDKNDAVRRAKFKDFLADVDRAGRVQQFADVMRDTDAALLQHMGVDGQKWADAFLHRFYKYQTGIENAGGPGHLSLLVDGGTMISWFACAILAGYDDAVRKLEPARLADARARERLEEMIVWGFNETHVPIFIQGGKGAKLHELMEPVTAEEVTGYVREAVRLRAVRDKLLVSINTPITLVPIPMVLYCPRCGQQHIDKEETKEEFAKRVQEMERPLERWLNPPHISHLCHNCRCVWRPADVPTTGVLTTISRGKADTWPNTSKATPAI